MQQPPTTYTVNGRKVRELRMAAGLELAELAERAGISRRYLSHIENGTRNRMRPARYQRLRQALGAHEEELLAPPETDPPKEHPRAQREVPPIRPPQAAG
ncbi:helix-turn-helix domain-containing protein [Streptomyces sp. KL116D]|uniref:helix-turn-helix domain-containing protein n=1 Tax=Streptomyces sp. KL116D TaxID=3045152 RepID=UPI003556BC96